MSVYLDYLVEQFEDNPGPDASEAAPRDGGTIDANKYTASVPVIKDLLKDKSALERLEALGIVAVTTMVPIIAVGAWVLEIYGPDEFINNNMHNNMIFYNIARVLIKDKVLT